MRILKMCVCWFLLGIFGLCILLSLALLGLSDGEGQGYSLCVLTVGGWALALFEWMQKKWPDRRGVDKPRGDR
jgi:hypothetical protein